MPEEPSELTPEGASRPASENATAEATGRLTPAPAGVAAVAGSRTPEVGPVPAPIRANVVDPHSARCRESRWRRLAGGEGEEAPMAGSEGRQLGGRRVERTKRNLVLHHVRNPNPNLGLGVILIGMS